MSEKEKDLTEKVDIEKKETKTPPKQETKEKPEEPVVEEVTDEEQDFSDFLSSLGDNIDSLNYEFEEIEDTLARTGDFSFNMELSENSLRSEEVDLNDLTITKVNNPIEKSKLIQNAVYGNKKAFGITLTQSGYNATVSPLVHNDVLRILESSVTTVEYRRTLYELIYNKIVRTVPSPAGTRKMEYEEWLKRTSFEDIDTYFYGLFASTYPNNLKFKIRCPKCGEEHEYEIGHRNLTPNTDEELRKAMISVRDGSRKMADLKTYSLIGEEGDGLKGHKLPETGMVVVLKTPSLHDSIETLSIVPNSLLEDSDSTIPTNLLYTSRFLIPDNSGGYVVEKSVKTIYSIIRSLGIEDTKELEKLVAQRFNERRLNYTIKGLKCANTECNHEFEDTPVSIENLLFTVIFEKIQG